MYFKSKRISLVILGITAVVCSKVFFATIDDPEGPNLLIVTVLALILFFLSTRVYSIQLSITEFKRVLVAISIQILLVGIIHFLLNL